MSTNDHGGVAEIPIFDVAHWPSADLCRRNLNRVRTLVDDALSQRSHALLPLAMQLLDRVSHWWLVRQANPYLEEIRAVAAAIGRPGAYFLNTIYEWACSTSAAPDPEGVGARMIRVLDWGLAGIGGHVVIARHETPNGAFYNATWPGFSGMVTGLAPGRFAAAINQAPRMPLTGVAWLDEVVNRLRVLFARGVVPASHLLRRCFEEARDYSAAVALLADRSIGLATPALFTLAGVEPHECCVIEAWGRERRVHRATSGSATIGVANQWLSPDLPGRARNHSRTNGPPMSAEDNNTARRMLVCRLQEGRFAGAVDLPEPILNSHTVMVITANARTGAMLVEALDPRPGEVIPRVVARRQLPGAAPEGLAA